MITQITHVGHVVRDLDKAIDLYTKGLGFKAGSTQVSQIPGGKAFMIVVGSQTIELIEPIDSEHRVGKFLEAHGEGWFHVSMRCDDIEATVSSLRQNGIEVENPRFILPNRPGPKIAFINSKSVYGGVIELNERGPAPPKS
jgi:methylmalonyl-CoA/ethylmalonyl-CoA epimerase